jgi:hypothetical protein
MLPNLGQLALNPSAAEAPTPTGEFYALSKGEADALNAKGVVDPLTQKELEPGRALTKTLAGHRASFRVRHPNPNPDGTYDYWYFNNAWRLWKHVQNKRRYPPEVGADLWYEDYMAMKLLFGEGDVSVPGWVEQLPRLGNGDDPIVLPGRRERVTDWARSWVPFSKDSPVRPVKHYGMDEMGNKLLMRIDVFRGNKLISQDYYRGPPGKERMVRSIFVGGYDEQEYEGEPGEERLTQSQHAGRTSFFKGPKGHERLWKDEDEYMVTYYDDDERPTRQEWKEGSGMDGDGVTGQVNYFVKGPSTRRRDSYLQRTTLPDGRVFYYNVDGKGPGTKELVERIEYPDGRVEFYDVSRDRYTGPHSEYLQASKVGLLRTVYPDGRVVYAASVASGNDKFV